MFSNTKQNLITHVFQHLLPLYQLHAVGPANHFLSLYSKRALTLFSFFPIFSKQTTQQLYVTSRPKSQPTHGR